MIVVGIDPGKTGGIAAVDGSGKVYVVAKPMPVTNDGHVDSVVLAKYLNSWSPSFIFIESVHAMPGQGVTSMFSFGRTVGQIDAVCELYRAERSQCPIGYVTPQKWMKFIHSPTVRGDTKERSLQTAKMLFPRMDFLATSRSKVPHMGMVEALLIAEYGRQSVLG